MDSLASTAVTAREASDVSPQERDRPWSERCAAMSVAYFTHTPSTGLEPAPNTIEIQFEVVFPLRESRRQTALVRGPHISVIPANRPHSIHAERRINNPGGRIRDGCGATCSLAAARTNRPNAGSRPFFQVTHPTRATVRYAV